MEKLPFMSLAILRMTLHALGRMDLSNYTCQPEFTLLEKDLLSM